MRQLRKNGKEKTMGITVGDYKVEYYDENQEKKGEVTFPLIDQDTVDINHTFVDSSLRGMGMAGKLMEVAVQEIRKQGKKAVLTCSYAVKWFDSHQEYQDILK